MPLQQIQLDQSIYNKQQPKWGAGRQPQRSPVSEALTPPQGPMGGGLAAALAAGEGATTNKFVEEQKAIWAEEDKLKKLERDAKLAKAQEIGMRVEADAQEKQEATMAQVQQQAAAKQKIEADPESAAKEYYNMILSMPDDTQGVLLNQLFAPINVGSAITTAGKTKTMALKYNVMANVFLSKGWATIDKAGRPVLSDPERKFEKGTFKEMENGDILNEATGEVIARGGDEPEAKVDAIVKQVRDDALAVVKANPDISLEDATHDAGIDYGLSDEEAVEIAKFTEMPESAKKKNAFVEWFNKWSKRGGAAVTAALSPETEKAKGRAPKAEPAFNEDIARTLAEVISDDVTAAERAHFKSQGASDADIDEAIKRKGSK